MSEHEIIRNRGCEPGAYFGYLEATCKCGWKGQRHYAHEALMYTLVTQEANRHMDQHRGFVGGITGPCMEATS